MSDQDDHSATAEQAPTGAIEIRSAEVINVSFPERTIEVIVAPYEQRATVMHEGRAIHEVFSRDAFRGIERRANRIRINRDHDVTRTVGRAVAFHPGRKEGLVADLRIAKTDLGDETLELAQEGILDASAGFVPMQNGVEWDATGSTRRLTRVWLAHVAMTPDPAYEGARVLAVRNASVMSTSGTPNLDLVRSWRLTERYDRLS